MKMVALPCGKQSAIYGPAVNDLTSVCTLLLRLPQMVTCNGAKEEAMLQGALYVPVNSTSKGASSLTAVEIKQPIEQTYTRISRNILPVIDLTLSISTIYTTALRGHITISYGFVTCFCISSFLLTMYL